MKEKNILEEKKFERERKNSIGETIPITITGFNSDNVNIFYKKNNKNNNNVFNNFYLYFFLVSSI